MIRFASIVTIATLCLPVTLAAQATFGPQLSWGTDSDLGLGARIWAPLSGAPPFSFTGSADYFFGDERPGTDVSWVEVNGGIVLPVSLAPTFRPYLGGGLNLAFVSVDFEEDPALDRSDVDIGLNLLGGWQGDPSRFRPFLEVRAVVGGTQQLVLTAGVFFGSR